MSLTVKDSCDLNTALRFLLGIEGPAYARIAPEDALRAAERLVARANATLGAGLTPEQVGRAWPFPSRRTKGAAR